MVKPETPKKSYEDMSKTEKIEARMNAQEARIPNREKAYEDEHEKPKSFKELQAEAKAKKKAEKAKAEAEVLHMEAQRLKAS